MRRQTRLGPRHIQQARRALSLGSTRSGVALACGVSRATLYRWLNRGESMRDSLSRGEILGEPTRYELLCMELVEVIEDHDGSRAVERNGQPFHSRANEPRSKGDQHSVIAPVERPCTQDHSGPRQESAKRAPKERQDSTLSEPKRAAKGPQKGRKTPPPQNTEDIDTPRPVWGSRSRVEW